MTVLGGPYATRAQLKSRMSIPDSDTSRDDDVDRALLSGADAIHRWTGRQFGRAEVASVRTFTWGPSGLDTDDFWTTDDLLVAGVAWSLVDPPYALEPANGIVDQVPGWPYHRFASLWTGHPVVPIYVGTTAIAAKWGWEDTPGGVSEANLLLAADDLKSADAPFGVAGFGDYVVRVRANPKVAEKLAPYVIAPIKVAS
jgi:hypothetical protein